MREHSRGMATLKRQDDMTNPTRVCDRCGTSIAHLHHNARRCDGCPKRIPTVLPERPCDVCGAIYRPARKDAVCCSKTCRDRRLNRKYLAEKKAAEPPLTCPGCGVEFKAWRTDQKYCTSVCGNRHRARANYQHADLTPRPCEWCGETFSPKWSITTVCSRLCSRRLSYQTHREKKVAAAVRWGQENRERRAVIAMNYKANRRGWETTNPGSIGIDPSDWVALLRRHNRRCAYCGGDDGGIHMDHVIPLSRGGRHAIANVLPACRKCNLSKGSKLLMEWKQGVMRHDRRTRSHPQGPGCHRTPHALLG